MSIPHASLYINGEWRPANTGVTFEVRNPHTKALVSIATSASTQDCDDAANAAERALSGWENTPIGARRDILLRAADIITSDRYKQRLKEALQNETAAPDYMFNINMMGAANNLRGAAGQLASLKGETFPSAMPGAYVVAQRRAIGAM